MRMRSAGASLTSFGSAWNRHVALPVVGLGALATKSSLDFHHSMMQISESAGAPQREVAKLNGQVLALARNSIYGPRQLADALFHIESDGYRGAQAMRVLNAAQQLAMVGNADLATTTYALVSAQRTHIKGTETLAKTIGSLNAVVGNGDMHMQDLTAALSSGVLVAAKNVGISLNDVGAALDVMTSRGMPAEESATRLRMTLSLMSAPTRAAQRALAAIGLSATDLAEVMRREGLPAAVQLLHDKLATLSKTDANMVLARAFGGGRSSAAIMTLVQNVDDLHGRLRLIERTAGSFNAKLREARNEDTNRLKRDWSAIQASLVRIGDMLVPEIVPAVDHIATAASTIGDAFAHLPRPMRSAVVDAALIAASLGVAAKAVGMIMKGAGSLSALKLGSSVAKTAATEAAATETQYLAAQGLGRAAGPAGMLGFTPQAVSQLYRQPNVGIIGARELEAMGGSLATPEAFAAKYGGLAGARYAMPVSELGASSQSMLKSLGSTLSNGLATAMRYAIPGAIAAAGFGDALASAVKGDTHQALFKAGGMAAGGIVGGLMGGIPGAMIGSGLGSMAGGLLGSLLGGPARRAGYGFADRWAESVAERLNTGYWARSLSGHAFDRGFARVEGIAAQLARSSKAWDVASKAQQTASRSLAHSSQTVVAAHARQKRATDAVAHAEAALAAVRRRYPAGAAPVVNAEARVIAAKDRDRRATDALKRAERLHGVELAAAKITYREAWKANQQLTWSLEDKIKATQIALAQDVKDIKSKGMSAARLRALQQDQQAEIDTQAKLRRVREDGIQLEAKAAQQIGPAFIKTMTRQQDTINDFGTSTLTAFRRVSQLTQEFPHATVEMDRLGRVSVTIRRGFDDMANTFARTSERVRPSVDQLTTNFAGFTDSVYRGETTTVSNLNKGLAAFGVKPVNFSLTKPRRQTGGMVVPGTGTGDKVHLQALVEPGEIVHVLNMRAARDRRKLAALEAWNAETPRFQGGGWTAGLQPGIIAATNALLHQFPGLAVTSALRTSMPMGHPDFHNTGQATDMSGAPDLMLKAAEWIMSSGLATRLTEGIHNPNLSIKYGRTVPPGFWGASTWARHLGHIHMAVLGALGSFAGGAADRIARVILNGPAGPLRSLGQHVEDRLTKGANRYLSAHAPAVSMAMETGASGMAGPGRVAGRVSTFGPPGEAAGRTASGLSDSQPGIALNIAPGTDAGWNNATTRGWVQARQPFDVAIGSHHGVLPVIDEGPDGSTGRAIDVTGAGARLLGIDPLNFPTDSYGIATLVRRQLGGIVRLATGGTVGKRRARGTSPSTTGSIHARVSRRPPKHKARKRRHPPDTIADALAPFVLTVSDVLAPLRTTVGELTGRLDALSNQESLLGTIAGQENNTFVLGADMPFLGPTLQAGESILAGMDLPTARRAYDHAVALANGTSNPELDLQGQLLDWIGSQADHQLLTPQTLGILAGTFGPSMLGFAPGTIVPVAQIQNLSAQLNAMGGQVKVEQAAVGVVGRAIRERTQRRKLVDKLAHAAKHRLDRINKDIDALTTGSLKARLAAARSGTARSRRIHDAQTERGHLNDLIANERASMKPDLAAIRGWQQRIRDIDSYIHTEQQPSTTRVANAEIALLKHTLTDERRGVEHELSQLTGSATNIGTGGMLGTIASEITTLADGRTTMQQDIARLVQSDIPSAQLELIGIQNSLPESERPTLSPGDAGSTDNSQLVELLTRQLQDTQTQLLVRNAQAPVFDRFFDLFPKFHTGGILGGGPVGSERMYVGRVGEGVFTPEQMASMAPAGGDGATWEIHHHYAPGMEWLRDFVTTTVRKREEQLVSKSRRRSSAVSR